MTINEAIEHSLERAEVDCSECANEHRQLAEWLMELRVLRNKQLPTKVKMDTENSTIECPICTFVFYSEYGYIPKYCPNCGKRLEVIE